MLRTYQEINGNLTWAPLQQKQLVHADYDSLHIFSMLNYTWGSNHAYHPLSVQRSLNLPTVQFRGNQHSEEPGAQFLDPGQNGRSAARELWLGREFGRNLQLFRPQRHQHVPQHNL
jgi:hypothetical protein